MTQHHHAVTCDMCGERLETLATAQNPSAAITPNSLARCPSCMILIVIGPDLQSQPPSVSEDKVAFAAAMNASPEVREWAIKTLETKRLRMVAEVKAECVAARAWLIARADPDLADDLATLDAYGAGFDAKGYTRAPVSIRRRAASILSQMRRQTGLLTSAQPRLESRPRTREFTNQHRVLLGSYGEQYIAMLSTRPQIPASSSSTMPIGLSVCVDGPSDARASMRILTGGSIASMCPAC